MKIILLFFAYFVQESFAQHLKGFQFIPNRKWRTPIDYDKWIDHERNGESTWMFDFEKENLTPRRTLPDH